MMMSAFCSYNCEKFCLVFVNFALVTICTRNMHEFQSMLGVCACVYEYFVKHITCMQLAFYCVPLQFKPDFAGKSHTNIVLSTSLIITRNQSKLLSSCKTLPSIAIISEMH